jgi:hypothetical protein
MVKGPVVSDVPVPAVSSTVSAAPVAVTSDPAVTALLMKLFEEINTLKEAVHRTPANIAAVHPAPYPNNPTNHTDPPAAGGISSIPNIVNNFHYHINTSK